MITIDQPGYLLLLILLPFLIYFWHFWKQRRGRIPLSLIIPDVPAPPVHLVMFRYLFWISVGFFWIGMALCIIALSGPAIVRSEQVYMKRGLDIMVLLDESPSMAAQDFRNQSRFEVAKRVITEFVEQRQNDAIGIVGVSSEAVLRVPPTLDYDTVIQTVNDSQLFGLGDGTALGMGILLASLHLQSGDAERKLIILVTDGANNTGEISPQTAAEVARDLNIHVYTIGIGSRDPVLIDITDPETGQTYRGTIGNAFNETLLIDIANRTQGRYFVAEEGSSLEEAFASIDSTESVDSRLRTRVILDPVHNVLLCIALLLFAADLLIRKLVLREGGIW